MLFVQEENAMYADNAIYAFHTMPFVHTMPIDLTMPFVFVFVLDNANYASGA